MPEPARLPGLEVTRNGVAVIGVATGTVFGLQARARWQDAETLCGDMPGNCTPESVARSRDAASAGNLSTLSFSLGLAASLPPDTGPADLYLGYPDDLGGTSEIPGDFLWAVEITVTEEVTLDRLGFLGRSTRISVMKVGLYAEDRLAPGQPGDLVASVQGVAVEEGACEGDVADVLLPPGTYWFAMMSDLGAELGSGTPDITHLYVNYDHNLALPESSPVTSSMLSPTLNVYLVVKP